MRLKFLYLTIQELKGKLDTNIRLLNDCTAHKRFCASGVNVFDSTKSIHEYYKQNAISADSFARALEFIINQPEDMDVNEILFRPTVQRL